MNSKFAKSVLLLVLLFSGVNCNSALTKPETIQAAPEQKETASEPNNTPSNTAATKNLAAPQKSPDALVRELYKFHTPEKSILGSKTRAPFDRFFDKNLADLFWKDLTTHVNEVGAIDFDPFYDAQDFEIKNLVVGAATINGTKATVPVTFTNYERKTRLVYSLVVQKDEWRISDVRYEGKITLLGIFKEAAKTENSSTSEPMGNNKLAKQFVR